jgi:DNA-binding transcriptional regulator/RsmH inhibitor MraZ
MFKGMFEHQLDDKNRIRIPYKFKKELTGENGEKSYSFFRGMNNCICVMSDDELDEAIFEAKTMQFTREITSVFTKINSDIANTVTQAETENTTEIEEV